jgi:hypothetical protein
MLRTVALPKDYGAQTCSLARSLEVLGERWAEPEVVAQRLNVLDQSVDPVRLGILRCLRRARTAVIQQDQRPDQRPVIAETAQISEIFDRLARTAGDAEQRQPEPAIRYASSVPSQERNIDQPAVHTLQMSSCESDFPSLTAGS